MRDARAGRFGVSEVRGIFERAVQLDERSRDAYLDSACGSTELRSRVERMLRAHALGDSWLLQHPIALAGGTLASDIDVTTDPPQVGRYEVVRRIGVGGMGVVYEGRQSSPRRPVAIKVMRYHLGSPSAVQRFRQEVEILGRLRHPAIAQIYDADIQRGEGEGVPYFVMELVADALPLTRYVRKHGCTLPQALTLFAQACDGVHHGHQKGVVHRDLKPDNILVDGSASPKIIDFGVARIIGADELYRTTVSELKGFLGTLQYMSPEQLTQPSDVDTRADVYALGVILYELLSGSPPHELRNVPVGEAIGTVLGGAVPRLSSRAPEVPRDLERIVHKAIESDRENRYQSAAELAMEVRRYLRREPILARPPSARYQLWLAVRRHRAAATIIAALAVALLATTVASVTFGVQATRARDESQSQLLHTRSAEQSIRRSIDSAPIRRGGMPARADHLNEIAWNLDHGLIVDNPRSQVAIRQGLAFGYLRQRLLHAGEAQALAALALSEKALGPDDDETYYSYLRVLANRRGLLSVWSQIQPRWDVSTDSIENAIRLHGPDDPLVSEGYIRYVLCMPALESFPVLSAWIDQQVRRHGAESENARYARWRQAAAEGITGRLEEAIPPLIEAVQYYEQHPFVPGEDREQLELFRICLGAAYLDLGLDAEALDAVDPSAHPDLDRIMWKNALEAINVHAMALVRLGRLDEAENELRPALDTACAYLGNNGPAAQLLVGTLVDALRERGELDEAWAVAARLDQVGPAYEVWTLLSLARLAIDSNDFDAALGHAQAVLDTVQLVPEERNVALAYGRIALAEAMIRSGAAEDAEAPLRGAINTLETTCRPAHPALAQAYRLLGEAMAAIGDERSAEDALDHALALDLEWRGPDARNTAASRFALGRFLATVGRVDEAHAEFDEAERILRLSPYAEGLWLPRVQAERALVVQ